MMDRQLLPEAYMDLYKMWAKAGLITVQIQENAPTNMFLSGITKYVYVAPTPAGLEASQKSSCGTPPSQLLRVDIATTQVEKIISNEEVKTALDTYRVVKGLATKVYTDVARQFHNTPPEVAAGSVPSAAG